MKKSIKFSNIEDEVNKVVNKCIGLLEDVDDHKKEYLLGYIDALYDFLSSINHFNYLESIEINMKL